MDTVRVGFIGCGRHSGISLYPSLRAAGLELVAVCDLDAARARSRAEEYKLKGFYTDYREMCDSIQMDAVLVAIGPQAHYELGMALLERGYRVWTEKPCAYSAVQADELARAAARAGRIAQVGFNYRYALGIQRARQLVASGHFATPAMVAVRWWLGTSDSLDFLHHYMVHAVDLLHYLVPGGLSGMHAERQRRDALDYYLATFRGPDGCIAVLELSANMKLSSHWCRVDWLSRDGILSVRDFTEVTHYGSPPEDGDRVWRTEPLIARGPFVQVWGYIAELDLFRQAVLGAKAPECTIQEAAWGMHVCEALLALQADEPPG